MTARTDPELPAVVFAVTESERASFFGSSALANEARAQTHWLSAAEMRPDHWEASLRRLSPTVLVTGWDAPALPEGWLSEVICPLRYVCHVTGSVRRLVPRRFIAAGGIVSNWGTLVAAQVAEHALLLALSALRNQSLWRFLMGAQVKGSPVARLRTRTLFGRKVGLHGFGGVARALVPLLRPFGVSITGFSEGVPAAAFAEFGIAPCASLIELFGSCEVLFECEALTPATAGSVSAKALDALPTGAVFVNVARGGLVDENALLFHAREGRIRLALDVVAHEPVTSESPVWRIPDAVLSPHIAGPTADQYRALGAHALENVARFLSGGEPLFRMTLEAYDRAT